MATSSGAVWTILLLIITVGSCQLVSVSAANWNKIGSQHVELATTTAFASVGKLMNWYRNFQDAPGYARLTSTELIRIAKGHDAGKLAILGAASAALVRVVASKVQQLRLKSSRESQRKYNQVRAMYDSMQAHFQTADCGPDQVVCWAGPPRLC